MKQARVLGYNVRKIMEKQNKSVAEMSKVLNCSEHDFERFLSGRLYLSLKQYRTVMDYLNVDPAEFLKLDDEEYNKSYVNCYGEFSDIENREKILDLIDNYIDLVEALEYS